MGDVTTLYRFFGEGGQLLYVGVAANPGNRFTQHSREKWWWADVVGSTMEHFPTRRAALDAETFAIKAEMPKHNRMGVEVRTTWPLLCKLEPNLLGLHGMCAGNGRRAAAKGTDPHDDWYEPGRARIYLQRLVGYHRNDPWPPMPWDYDEDNPDREEFVYPRAPRLETEEAYAIAYRKCFGALMDAWSAGAYT